MDTSQKALRSTTMASVSSTKKIPKLTDAEIESARNKILAHFELPSDETVRDAFACGMKGFRKGHIYITQNYFIFIGKKATFGESSRVWYWYDILDLYIAEEKIYLVDINPKVSVFNSFQSGAERAYKAIRRGMFGIDENTVLHQAVDNGDYDKIKLILDRDINLLSRVNKEEQTPLIRACLKNDIKMTRFLLDAYKTAKEKGEKLDINQKTSRGDHLLHAVCRSTEPIDDQILCDLLQFDSIDVTCKNHFDNTTPLHYFAQHTRSLQCQAIGKLFLKAGADPNATTAFNETPLHKAIFNIRVRVLMVEMLLDHKANPAAKGGKREDTPLHYAIRLQRKDLVLLLLSKGGDITVCNNEGADCVATAKSEAEYSPCDATHEILTLLEQVKELHVFLHKLDLESYAPKFIENGLHDFDILCDISEDDLVSTFDLKVGSRLKLVQAIAELKASRQAAKQRKEIEFTNRPHGLNSDSIRSKLGLKGGWEISAEELEFTAKLGQGASGQVFKGLYRGNEVAIKVLTATNVEQELLEFQKEFQILAALDSPYMITFFGAVVQDYLMMVMELCERGSLYDVLTKTPKELSWSRAVLFARDMAEGLTVLHNHNPQIIHRDLKSLNLLITKDWKCKVCDFGLSRLVQGDMKTFGRLCGTFAYACPEVFHGQKATDKSDVFSMGIVLWELINTAATGKYEQPYAEYHFTMDFQIIVQTAQGLRPTLPKGSQTDFVELFQQCVEQDPECRPSASEAAREIRKWQREISTPEGLDAFKSRVLDAPISGGTTPAMAPPQQEQTERSGFKGWGKKG